MKKQVRTIVAAAVFGIGSLALVACSTLPDAKLRDTASSVVGKPMEKVSDVRYAGDQAFYVAYATDGTRYNCQLSVLFGISSQHEQCELAVGNR